MKGWLIAVFFFGFKLKTHCQDKDTATYHIAFTGTGNINRTNNGTTFITNNQVRAGMSAAKLNLNFAAGWIFGENPISKTNNDFSTLADIDLFKKHHHWYYWALAGYETSYSLKVLGRIQAGGGIGYNLLDKTNASIALTDGLLYEKSSLAVPDMYGRNRYETLRNSFRLKYHFVIKEIITIHGSHFLQNAFGDSQDYIIRSNSSVGLKLTRWLNVNLSLLYNKFNLTSSQNLIFSYGLSIDKKF